MTGFIVILLLFGLFLIPIGGAIYCYRKGGLIARRVVGISLLMGIPVAIALSHTRVEWNKNTYAEGWPIPRVVWQREGPDKPYLDFIGWTLILAYPLNYLASVIIPIGSTSIIVATRCHLNTRNQEANKPRHDNPS